MMKIILESSTSLHDIYRHKTIEYCIECFLFHSQQNVSDSGDNWKIWNVGARNDLRNIYLIELSYFNATIWCAISKLFRLSYGDFSDAERYFMPQKQADVPQPSE
jgi:hypothetical protein